MSARHLALVAVAALAGCVPVQRVDGPADYVARQEALSALERWSVTGRIGVTLDERGFTGALSWRQDGERLDMRFHGPLGAGAFRLGGTPDELVLETSDGQQQVLIDPEATLRAQLGWSVPVDAMRYWLLGLPYPAWPATEEFDEAGNLVRLDQKDWRVEYDRYDTVDTWLMPRRVRVAGADVTVRLAIHDWTLTAPHAGP